MHATLQRAFAFTLVASSLAIPVAGARTLTANPSNFAAKLKTLKPGDILELEAGRYVGGLAVYNLVGEPTAPIVIRGPASDPRAVFEGTTTTNVVQLRGSSFVTLRNIEVDGMHREGFGVASDGVNLRSTAGATCSHDIVIENFHIHDLQADQQTVGISTTGCSAWNWTIRDNVIERVGTGMYLGNSDGSRQFFAGVIEHNLVIDTIGYNIEIKQQNARPSTPGMPTVDSRTIIRHNVFSKGANSSTGRSARPNLLVGHMPLSGPGQNDRYEIYGNFFFQNPTEALFQGEGNVDFYDNVLYNNLGNAVIVRAQNDRPRDIHIFNNTIVAARVGIAISGGAPEFTQDAFANAVFAATPISARNARDNVNGNFSDAKKYLRSPAPKIDILDLSPIDSNLSGARIDYSSVTPSHASTVGPPTDLMRDFDGVTHTGTIRGAYVYAPSSRWKLGLTKKPRN